MATLSIEKITKRYGAVAVIPELSLTVGRLGREQLEGERPGAAGQHLSQGVVRTHAHTLRGPW